MNYQLWNNYILAFQELGIKKMKFRADRFSKLSLPYSLILIFNNLQGMIASSE